MRLGNLKLEPPKPEEHVYTEAELDLIALTKADLKRLEALMQRVNEAWNTVIHMPPVKISPMAAHTLITRARHERVQTKRMLMQARGAYFNAVVPETVKVKRLAKRMGNHIREDLKRPSLSSQLFTKDEDSQ